ncbi:MAG: YeeE/YedE thiosulfate transporter family protein [Myxococcota bacterium]
MMPVYQSGGFDETVAMALATLIGVAFGFVLERSGFGRADVLSAQFFGTDMRVLKVMFTAIATVVLGIGVLAGTGVLDVGALVIPETFLGPQLVGGLLLGVGFVISGYCPGTAVVAAGSGHVDGLWSLGGVMLGALLFGAVYPLVEGFYTSGGMGVVTFPISSASPGRCWPRPCWSWPSRRSSWPSASSATTAPSRASRRRRPRRPCGTASSACSARSARSGSSRWPCPPPS